MAINLSALPIWLYRKAMSAKQSGKNPNMKNLSKRANNYFEEGEKYFEEKRFRGSECQGIGERSSKLLIHSSGLSSPGL